MGFLDFLKKRREQETISISQVRAWTDKYIEKQEIGTRLGILKREIHSKKTKLRELLNELSKAQLKNPEAIPERAITVMEGNRKSYIQKISAFLETLNPPENYEETLAFLEETSTGIEKLAEDTQKNYFILKDFLGDETRNAANKISDLDKTISQAIETFHKTPLEKANKIKELLKEHRSAEEELKELREQAQEIENRKLEHYEKRSKIEEKMNQIRKSPAYEDLEKLNEKHLEIKSQLKAASQKITSLFSDIEPALKKYSKKKRDGTLKKYLDDPVKALQEDENLKIVKHLAEMKEKIKELDLKQTKEARIEKTLKTLKEGTIASMRKELSEKINESEEYSKRIKNHSATLNMKEQESWLTNIDKNIELEEKNIEEISNKIDRVNPGLIKTKIKNLVKELDPYTELK